MEHYYLGGYYLIQLTPIVYFGETEASVYQTASGCINKDVFDYWCLSTSQPDEKEKLELGLTDEKIEAIKKWAGDKYAKGILKWGNAFSDLETAETFKNLFFPDLANTYIYSIYLPETDANALIAHFKNDGLNNGDFGLYHNLTRKIGEAANPKEEFLGYDFIGVEIDGSFHSFYCHGIGQELEHKFSLTFNKYGLFEDIKQPERIRQFLNDPATGVEPVPWFIAKTKRLKAVAQNQ